MLFEADFPPLAAYFAELPYVEFVRRLRVLDSEVMRVAGYLAVGQDLPAVSRPAEFLWQGDLPG